VSAPRRARKVDRPHRWHKSAAPKAGEGRRFNADRVSDSPGTRRARISELTARPLSTIAKIETDRTFGSATRARENLEKDDPKFFRYEDLLNRWNVSRMTVDREVKRGKLKPKHIAGTVRIPRDEVERYEKAAG
jgi:hypothetical protein